MYPSRRIIFALLLLGSSLLGCSSVGSNLPPLDQGPLSLKRPTSWGPAISSE
jgi:hypothetical protein